MTDASASSKPKPSKNRVGKVQPRHLARIGAVQALYQMDLAGADVLDVIQQFKALQFSGAGEGSGDADGELSGVDLSGGDVDFFTAIVNGVVTRQREIDPVIDTQLAEGWRLVRIDSILRAILRAGTYELLDRPDVPPGVVINEYIDVAHAFFSGDEPRVVNGVLDALAKQLRGDSRHAGAKVGTR